MKILGIDTSTKRSSLGIIEGDSLICEYGLKGLMTHSESIVEMVEDVFKKLDFKLEDIDLFAVGVGPGSFTGMRIAISIAKSFAQVLDKEIIGVSSLSVHGLKRRGYSANVIDARRGQIYASITKNDPKFEIVFPDSLISLDDFKIELSKYEDIVLSGPDAGEFCDFFGIKSDLNLDLNGADIARLGLIEYKRRGPCDLYEILPNYLKLSQAQLLYENKKSKDI